MKGLSSRRALWLLVLPVAVVHLWLAAMWPQDRFGLGDGTQAPARIDVSFVRDLQQSAPAAVPPQPVVRRLPSLRATAGTASSPGSSAETPASSARAPLVADAPLPELPTEAAAALPELAPAPELAAALAAVAPVAAGASAAPAAAASAGAFEWPPSTRLSYLLSGNYRGPVEGQARVEWRLSGQRYQVSLEVAVGPTFAPFVTRQLQSDGLVTAAGLEPQRYDESTQVALRAPRRLTITMEPEHVRLPSGRQVPRPSGVQDSASQFVHMTWLFTMQPERLRAGTLLQIPLALPRHVEVWTYEVLGAERIGTPMGELDTVHVRPLRPARAAGAAAGAGSDLVAEFWVAPTLQNLPVRILIRQDEETYVDLHLERLPQQAPR